MPKKPATEAPPAPIGTIHVIHRDNIRPPQVCHRCGAVIVPEGGEAVDPEGYLELAENGQMVRFHGGQEQATAIECAGKAVPKA